MKLKALVAAIALIGAGAANASYIADTDTSDSSALLMTLWDSTSASSAVFDLGVSRTSFLTDTVCTSGCTSSLVITWNLASNTVTTNLDSWTTSTGGAAYTLSSLGITSSTTNSWSSAYSQLSSLGVYSSSTSVYDVISFDRDGTVASASHALTTATSKPTPTNANLINMGLGNDQTFINGNATQGTHLTADNGADVITAANAYYQGQNFKSTWAGSLTSTVTTSLGNSIGMYEIDGVGTTTTTKATVTALAGTWLLSSDGTTLTYTVNVASVPEPSSIAMLLAGLGLMGLIARRRMA